MKPDRHKQLATRRYWAKKRGGKGVTEDVAPKDDASGTGMGTAHGDSTRGRGRGYGRARGRGRGVDRSSTTAGLPSNAWRFGDEQTGADADSSAACYYDDEVRQLQEHLRSADRVVPLDTQLACVRDLVADSRIAPSFKHPERIVAEGGTSTVAELKSAIGRYVELDVHTIAAVLSTADVHARLGSTLLRDNELVDACLARGQTCTRRRATHAQLSHELSYAVSEEGAIGTMVGDKRPIVASTSRESAAHSNMIKTTQKLETIAIDEMTSKEQASASAMASERASAHATTTVPTPTLSTIPIPSMEPVPAQIPKPAIANTSSVSQSPHAKPNIDEMEEWLDDLLG